MPQIDGDTGVPGAVTSLKEIPPTKQADDKPGQNTDSQDLLNDRVSVKRVCNRVTVYADEERKQHFSIKDKSNPSDLDAIKAYLIIIQVRL